MLFSDEKSSIIRRKKKKLLFRSGAIVGVGWQGVDWLASIMWSYNLPIYRAGSIWNFCCFFLKGGAAQHHGLIKETGERVSDSGTTTPTSNGDDASRSRSNSDDATSTNTRKDGLERNVSTPNDALHLERRVRLILHFLHVYKKP